MCIKDVGIINKVAWNIRNYRYVGDVSASPSLVPARPEQVNDNKDNFWSDMPS